MRSRTCLFALSLLLAGVVAAKTPVESSAPTTIGHITFVRQDVFDDKERQFPYSTANAVHIVTQESYLRRALLFREGDVYDSALIDESERLLRAQSIFRLVHVSTSEAADGSVDVTVETADSWTTLVRPSYGVAGSQRYYGLGFLEENLLGQGKQIGAFLFQDIDRRTSGASYSDPQLLGTRWTGGGGYGRDEKGREYEIDLDRPYYSARVRFAGGTGIHVRDDEDRLFQHNDEIVTFQHATRDSRVYVSHALEADPARVRRVTLAYERQEDRFAALRIQETPVFPLPAENRTISAALVGFEYQNIRFQKFAHVFTFDRVEDENLGFTCSAEVGPSLESLGATRDGALGRLQAQKIFNAGDHFVWFNNVSLSGRAEANTLRNGEMQIRSEAFLVDWREENTASLRGAWTASHNLDPENQYLLGGFNGLRAYQVRELSGANTAIATLENRTVITYDWLKLVNVGWALFADAGSAWQRGGQLRMAGVKSDLGAGLRFAFTRSTDPSLIRLDLAYALQDNESSSRLALNIGADIHFGERQVRKFEQ